MRSKIALFDKSDNKTYNFFSTHEHFILAIKMIFNSLPFPKSSGFPNRLEHCLSIHCRKSLYFCSGLPDLKCSLPETVTPGTLAEQFIFMR